MPSREREFGPYRLVHQIATGGMAEIHLAKTKGIGGFEKLVALKLIHPNFSADDHFVQMLVDEAKISVQLQHVNIAHTFDLGRVDDTYYIAMELVDGWDLFKVLRRASEQDLAMPVELAAYVCKEVLGGLDYAHRKRDAQGNSLGIVHRDISPQNVLLSTSGEVKVVDFGIAKATTRVKQTAVGVIKGKYYYMSPEQAWGDPLDHRTDLFSAGILLYEMLTGQMLYLEEDIQKLLDMVRKAHIDPPSTKRNGVPRDLERIVMRALAKKADMRWQSAQDFATALERFLHAHAPGTTSHRLAAFLHQVMGDESPLVQLHRLASDPGKKLPERESIIRSRGEFTDENSIIFGPDELAKRARETALSGPPSDTASTDLPAIPPPRRAPRGSDDHTRPGGVMPVGGATDDVPLPLAETARVSRATADLTRPANRPALARRDAGRQAGDMTRPGGRMPTDPTHVGGLPDSARTREQNDDETLVSSPPGFTADPTGTIDLDEAQLIPAGDVSLLAEPLATGDISLVGQDSIIASIDARAESSDDETTRLDVAALAGRSRTPSVAETQPHVPAVRPRPSRKTPRQVAVPVPVNDRPSAPQPWAPGPASPWQQVSDADDASGHKLRPSARDRRRRWAIFGGSASVIALSAILFALFAPSPGASATASLEIISIPAGARVRIDGADRGLTPLVLEDLAVGTKLAVRIELERHDPWQKEEVVNEARHTKVLASLKPILGTLVVQTQPPAAEVFLNGQSLGRTPLEKTDLDPFRDGTLELRKPGFRPHRQPLTWSGQRRVEIRLDLEKGAP